MASVVLYLNDSTFLRWDGNTSNGASVPMDLQYCFLMRIGVSFTVGSSSGSGDSALEPVAIERCAEILYRTFYRSDFLGS